MTRSAKLRGARGFWAALCLAGICATAHAQADAPTAEQAEARTRLIEEREQRVRDIGQERARIRELQSRESALCYQRFVVNSCIQAAVERYRKELTALRREETAINNAEREREGEEQRARIASQERADRNDAEKAAAQGARSPTQEDRIEAAQDKQRQQDAEQPGRAQQAEAQRQRREREQADAQRRRAQMAEEAPAQAQRFDAKQREAQARREERNRRVQERASKAAEKPLPQPLPPRVPEAPNP